jgi:TonB family protein
LNLLSDQNISGLTAAQLRYAINEMYARHGADFRDPEIKGWFAQFEWYRPRPGLSYDDTEKLFSYVETENVKRLGTYRDARRAGVPPTKPLTAGTQAPLANHATADRSRARPRQPPRLVYAPQPTYPYTARKEGVTGSGRFRIRFDARGNATSVDVIQSTGNRPLDMNTIYYLKFWRIAPGNKSELVVPISYVNP